MKSKNYAFMLCNRTKGQIHVNDKLLAWSDKSPLVLLAILNITKTFNVGAAGTVERIPRSNHDVTMVGQPIVRKLQCSDQVIVFKYLALYNNEVGVDLGSPPNHVNAAVTTLFDHSSFHPINCQWS